MKTKSKYTVVCEDGFVVLKEDDDVVIAAKLPMEACSDRAVLISGLLSLAGLLEVAQAIREISK